jgi:hypothetical protein
MLLVYKYSVLCILPEDGSTEPVGTSHKAVLSLFPSHRATCHLANHRGADQRQPPLAGCWERGLHSSESQWIQRHYSDNEQVRTDLHREAASPSQPASTADYESADVTSRPQRWTSPIASFPAQPSKRASATLPGSSGLHSVQSSCSLHLACKSYEQWPF